MLFSVHPYSLVRSVNSSHKAGVQRVEAELPGLRSHPFQEIPAGEGKQPFCCRCVASPADALSVFVLGGILLGAPRSQSNHVDDQRVDRDVDRFEFPRNLLSEYCCSGSTSSRTCTPLWGRRRGPVTNSWVGERLFVVVAIGEDGRGPGGRPGRVFPPTPFHFRTVGVSTCRRLSSTTTDQPARDRSPRSIGSRPRLRPSQPSSVRVVPIRFCGFSRPGSRRPLYRWSRKTAFRVPIGEFTVFDVVGERKGRGGDGHFDFVASDPEGRDQFLRLTNVSAARSRNVCLLPLHADQLRREYRNGRSRF